VNKLYPSSFGHICFALYLSHGVPMPPGKYLKLLHIFIILQGVENPQKPGDLVEGS